MERCILVSVCTRLGKAGAYFEFHGHYRGQKIREVFLETLRDESRNWQRGEEYRIWIEVINCEDGVLYGHCLHVNRLCEIRIDF